MPSPGPIDSYHSCIVVGAGLAGLYAAQQLKERYPDVLVVEAQDHVGGRVRQVSKQILRVIALVQLEWTPAGPLS
jgi:monoamine oxidase